VAGAGFELASKFPQEMVTDRNGGAESGAYGALGATSDPTLKEVIEAWPSLSEPIKAGALALIRAASQAK
jgi:hypothetical protein